MQTVTIVKSELGGFTVWQGNRMQDGLAWDEMLGVVVELTHPKLGTPRLDLHTPEFWSAQRKKVEADMEFNRALNNDLDIHNLCSESRTSLLKADGTY